MEDFYSKYGTATVSKLDGLEGTETLSSQGAHASEVRLGRGFGTTITAATGNNDLHQLMVVLHQVLST